jgi:2',3'-cyclic-nucleotide 2'-phosphodiesterase (5'-nucleotidase family)
VYEGKAVVNDQAVVQAMAPALQRVHALQATPLGVFLDVPMPRAGTLGSPLGNLFAEAIRDAVPGADVAAVNNAARGLWADLPEGAVTVGRLYDVFPFDNRVRRLTVTGAELRRWVSNEIQQGRRSGLGIAGLTVSARCLPAGLHVDLARADGRPVDDGDRLLAVTIAAPTLSGGLASADFLGSVESDVNAAVVREVVEDWFSGLGRLSHDRLAELTRQTSAGSPIAPCTAARD